LLATVFHVKHIWTILHGGALGDLALTLRLARGLPGVEPAGRLRVVSRTTLAALRDGRPALDCRSSETAGLTWLYGDGQAPPPVPLRKLISGQRVLNALDAPDSPLHRRLLQLAPRALYSFDPRPQPACAAHIVTQWRRTLAAQGLDVTADEPPYSAALRVSPRCVARGRAQLIAALDAHRGAGKRRLESVVLMHPGSGGVAKCWPLEAFVIVARQLADSGKAVAWLLGPAELERWPAQRVASLRAEFAVLAPPSAGDLLDVLAAAGLLIANDSGPAHLAALIGTPTVAIFGPTSPDIWRPLGPGARVIRGDPNRAATWGIEPAAVAAAAAQIVTA